MTPIGRITRNFDYSVTLGCGCVVKMRNPPMTDRQTYGCTTGQRHGYSIRWLSFTGQDGVCYRNRSIGEEGS